MHRARRARPYDEMPKRLPTGAGTQRAKVNRRGETAGASSLARPRRRRPPTSTKAHTGPPSTCSTLSARRLAKSLSRHGPRRPAHRTRPFPISLVRHLVLRLARRHRTRAGYTASSLRYTANLSLVSSHPLQRRAQTAPNMRRLSHT